MSIDGGRLKAHNDRIKDFRRGKEGKLKGSNIKRSKSNEKIQFDEIDSVALDNLKKEIRDKAGKKRKIDIALLIISVGIAITILYLFTQKYS